MDRADGGLYGCGWLRKSSGIRVRGEPRRGGECGGGRESFGCEVVVSEFGLRIRWQEDFALRDGRCAESAERLRKIEGGGRSPVAGSVAAVLHRADFVAVWRRRKMFSGYDSETRGDPANARCSERSAWLPNLFSRSSESNHPV